MKKLTYAMIAFLTFVFAPLSAQVSAKKPTVVIVPFEAKGGMEQEDCEVITERFISEYVITGAATVVNRATLSQVQKEQKFQASDWSNSDKTAKLGKVLNAQQLVSGQLRLYNGLILVTVQVQDIETLAVLASMYTQVNDMMELLDTIPAICKNISSQMQGESASAVAPTNTPSTKPVQTTKSGTDKAYQIGDIGPGGGYVFYYSVSGFPVYSGDTMTICHYLECSPDMVGDNATWCPCTEKPWCNVETNDAIGAGKKNTENIISANHSGKSLYAFNCAAKACAEYSTKTTKPGEWYLPSRVELDLIYQILVKGKVITYDESRSWHWSSSQYGNFIAWGQRFSGGRQRCDPKYGNYCVRAVRAF